AFRHAPPRKAFRQACGFHTVPRTRVTKSVRATRCQSCKKAGKQPAQLLGNALMGASGGLAARGSSAKGRSLGQYDELRQMFSDLLPPRHQPSRPPLAKIRPGSPAPAMGPGTALTGLIDAE